MERSSLYYDSLLDALEKASDYEVNSYHFKQDSITAEFDTNKLKNIALDEKILKDMILLDLNDLNANITEKNIEIIETDEDTVKVKFI